MSIISKDILQKTIPYYHIYEKIEQETGAKIYFAGGVVRDILLNKEIHDVDLVAENIDYISLAKAIGKNIKSYPVTFKDNMRIMKNNNIIDVSKLRGKNIYEDVLKRDFTINYLACSLNGEIIGDEKDIYNKTVRAVSETIFDDDPLRIIRALRFSATYGFIIDSDTLKLMENKKELIKKVAKERILEEFRKIFQGKYIEYTLNVISNNILSPILDVTKINNNKLLNALKETDNFHLLLYIWVKDKKFIEHLGLTSKEQKYITEYEKIDYNSLLNYDKTQLEQFVFYNHNIINNISLIFKYDYNNMELAEKVIKIDLSLDYNRSELITGKLLQSFGYKPSPLFAEIIKEVSFLLANNSLSPHNISEYINNKWGGV